MKKYIIGRLLSAIPVIIGVSLLSFLVMHLAPGDPTAMFINPSVKPEELARIRTNWGLDKPIMVQYFYWLWNALHGDLGTAYLSNRPVLEMIMEKVPATLLLTVTSMILTLIIAVPLGVYSAIKKNGIFDNTVTLFSFIGMSIPSFWLALMLMLVFSLNLGILPAGGMYDPLLRNSNVLSQILDIVKHMILPVTALTILGLAGIARFVRSEMLEVLKQNYIRTARAKGLPENVVLFKHALRNALLPLITLSGMMLPDLFAGAFIIETVFAWPGMGRLGVSAVFARNYPLIMGVVMFSSILIITGNMMADVFYAIADPRIRLGDKKR